MMEIDRIEFSSDKDDDRVIAVGRGLPFRFGKATVDVHGTTMHITIKADSLTTRAMVDADLIGASWLRRSWEYLTALWNPS